MTRARGESPRDFCHTWAPYEDVHWSMFAVVSSWDVHFMKLRELITYRRGGGCLCVASRYASWREALETRRADVRRCRASPPTTSRSTAP